MKPPTRRAPLRAIVREVPDSFAGALCRDPHGRPPRPDVARDQHASYVHALESLGVAVTVLPADESLPDCPFVEDMAVVAGGVAFVTFPGAPSRRDERRAVRAALAAHLPVVGMEGPATLDGGDVLKVGSTLVVGRSGRTDAGGVAALRQTFEPLGYTVIDVAVGDALHLKTQVSAPRADLVVMSPGWLDPHVLPPDASVLVVPEAEKLGANVVGIGESVLVAEGFPETEKLLRGKGLEVVTVDVSEFGRADGSVSCLCLFY